MKKAVIYFIVVMIYLASCQSNSTLPPVTTSKVTSFDVLSNYLMLGRKKIEMIDYTNTTNTTTFTAYVFNRASTAQDSNGNLTYIDKYSYTSNDVWSLITNTRDDNYYTELSCSLFYSFQTSKFGLLRLIPDQQKF
jgi:hypothetical protein